MGPVTAFFYRKIMDRSLFLELIVARSWTGWWAWSERSIPAVHRSEATQSFKEELIALRNRP